MINLVKNNSNIYFAGVHSASVVRKPDGSTQECRHQTFFMRDYPILDFSVNYLKEKFPQGTNIADFACSHGQETLSLAMLMDDVNKDKKYKFTGIDLSPVAIDHARQGGFVVEPLGNEGILFPPNKRNQESEEEYYFTNEKGEEIDYTAHINDIDCPKDKEEKINGLFSEWFYEPKVNTREKNDLIRKLFPFNKLPAEGSKLLFVKDEKIKDIVDFQVGDIEQFSSILPARKTGAVFFQNALYHVTKAQGSGWTTANIPPARRLFNHVNNVLEPGGLLVIGRLARDHLAGYDEKRTHLMYQNNKQLEVFDSSPIHDALRDAGFEPIFYAKDSVFGQVHLPAVWKKTGPIKVR